MSPDPNEMPLQPPDETPLPQYAIPATAPPQAQAIPGIAANIGSGRDDIVSAATEHADQLNGLLQDHINSVEMEATATAAGASTQIDKAAGPIYQNLTKVMNGVTKTLETPYTDMWQYGVKTPLHINDMVSDLEDTSYSAITGRFANAGGPPPQPLSPPPPTLSGAGPPPQPLPPPPQPGLYLPPPEYPPLPPGFTCPAGKKPAWNQNIRQWGCVDDLTYVPPPPPPIQTTEGPIRCAQCQADLPDGWVCPRDPNDPLFQSSACPVGYQLAPVPGGNCWGCRPVESPLPPPPPLGPPPPPEGCVTVQQQCVRVPLGKYWVAVKCVDECTANVCVYYGANPPTGVDGNIVAGPLDTQPTSVELTNYGKSCIGKSVTVPPVPTVGPPPPPPIGQPPPPPPPPPTKTPPPKGIEPTTGTVHGVNWSAATACAEVESLIEEEISVDEITNASSSGVLSGLPQVKSIGSGFFSVIVPSIVGSIFSNSSDSDKSEFSSSSGLNSITLGVGMVRDFFDKLTGNSVPNKSAAFGLGTQLALANLGEKVSGFPLTYLAQSIQYSYQYANPQFLPTQSDIDGLYLTNRITSGLWECYTRANGNIPSVWSMVLDSKQVKPIPDDVISLYRRGLITNVNGYYARMRELGITDTAYSDELYALSEELPGISDQIRFMVRDVWDETVVAKFKYDKDYDKKFAGKAKQLARATGVSEDWFKYYWRAHWEIPSNTALYEMLHRLRPDRPEVENFRDGDLGMMLDANGNQVPIRPTVVTVDDVRNAIEVNDMSPGWINPIIDISYRPITNSDAVRAYEIGTFNSDDLYHALRDNGYSDKDAKTLVVFYSGQRSRKVANAAGVWTTRKTIRAYKDGMIDRQQADNLLAPIIIDPKTRTDALNGADLEADVEAKRTILNQFRKRYLYGDIADSDLHDLLQSQGIQPAAVARIETEWFNEKQGRAKEPRVQMLCQWYTHGLLTNDQYFTRLTRLGYSNEDAGRIANVCRADQQAKLAKQAAQAAEKARKETEQQLRQQKADIRQQITDLQKELKDYQSQIDKAKKELEKQQKEQKSQQGSTQQQ